MSLEMHEWLYFMYEQKQIQFFLAFPTATTNAETQSTWELCHSQLQQSA